MPRHAPFLLTAGLLWLILSVVAFANLPQGGSPALPLFLLAFAVLWLLAGLLIRGTADGVMALGTPDLGASLLLLGGVTLTVELTFRLLCSRAFGGQPAAFDFGLKGVDCSATNASLLLKCQPNVPFTPEFNSFGHCIQGALSLLLVPAVEHAASFGLPRWLSGRPALIVNASSCVAIYPLYNIIKRTARARTSFASSSFANNGAEWSIGFLLGLSAAVFAVAYSTRRRPPPTSANDRVTLFTRPLRSSGQPPPPPSCRGESMEGAARAVRVGMGALLFAATLVAAILFGLSWDNTAFDLTHTDDFDLRATILLCAVPPALAVVWCAVAAAVARARGASLSTAAPHAAAGGGWATPKPGLHLSSDQERAAGSVVGAAL